MQRSEVSLDRARDALLRERLASLRSILDRRGRSAALLTSRRNFAWLTAGGTGHVLQSSESAVAGVLVTRAETVIVTQNIEAARLADEEIAGLGLEVVPVPWWEPGALEAEVLRRLPAGERPATDGDLEPELSGIRSLLSPFELDRMEVIGRTAHDAMRDSLAAARPGMTEHDLVADLLGHLPGVRVPVVLAAADGRIGRYRHPLPGVTPIRSRVMLVVVAERWGLHVAMTRFRELDEPGADLARRMEAVAIVQAAMHEATRPGATLGDVFDVARSAYADVGFPDEWRDHHQGGSIGYQARERIAVPGDAMPIELGMAFAWNPSIAGAKAEDTIVIVDEAARTMTK